MPVCPYFDKVTVSSTIAAYKRMNYPLFENGNYNLNIFGIRNNQDPHANTFNDLLGVLYKVNGEWKIFKGDATTDAGIYYRKNLLNPNGTGILAPGYHKGGWAFGKHQGKYEALVQHKALPIYRDNNRDDKLDITGTPRVEMAGINIHRATAIKGNKSILVDKWSAACMVWASESDFSNFMDLVKTSMKTYGPVFSMALFNSKEFFDES